MKTVDDFIKELQLISEDKRKLPILIVCPNGLSVEPSIKMRVKAGTIFTSQVEAEAMVITWE
jgi:hypothetical protein